MSEYNEPYLMMEAPDTKAVIDYPLTAELCGFTVTLEVLEGQLLVTVRHCDSAGTIGLNEVVELFDADEDDSYQDRMDEDDSEE